MKKRNILVKVFFRLGIAMDPYYLKKLRKQTDLCKDLRKHGIQVYSYNELRKNPVLCWKDEMYVPTMPE